MEAVLVTEWIEKLGGAEKVLDAFVEALHITDVYCTWNDDRDRYPGEVAVHESVLAKTPLRGRKALSVPFLPSIIRNLQLPEADWVLASSHLFSHHVRVAPGCKKFIYVHTPARYIWVPALDSRAHMARALLPVFRSLDKRRAAEATSIAANSRFVAERVKQCWDLDSHVVHPPVAVEAARYFSSDDSLTEDELTTLSNLPDQFILGASRLVIYKELDKVIHTGNVTGMPVVVVGDGPDRGRLAGLAEAATVPVVLLGAVSDQMLYALYRRAFCFVFPPIEDFGIMPVEAMSSGARVIVNRVGGASESVLDGITGAHCDFADPRDVRRCMDVVATLDGDACRRRADDFGTDRFVRETKEWLGLADVRTG